MTAVTASRTRPPQTRGRAASPYHRTFLRTLRSEWIKLSTLRSTWWSIGVVAVLTIGIAALIAQVMDAPGMEPIQAVVSPVQFTMLLAGVLGVIAVTGEYSTGMVRSTLTAVPVRGAVLAAKSIAVAVILFVTSFLIFLAAAVVVSPILAGRDMAFPWDAPGDSLVPMLAASVSMAVFGLIGVAFGFLLRSGAGAIAATVGLLFVLPIVMSIFAMPAEEWQWIRDVSDHLPMSAAQSAILPQEDRGLDVPTAYLTLGAWVGALMLSAWAVVRTRDA